MKQWVLHGTGSFDCLKLEEAPIPEVGDHEVLVKIHAASLNYRDLMIATGTYYWSQSDGAGEVVSIGSRVKRFRTGQRVIPTFFQGFISGALTQEDSLSALGALADGVLREYAVFPENGLVHMPTHLSYEEAATLPCAGLTAWNALYGSGSRPLRAGDTVLTQGTGGVSIFALQFGVAAGAEVISTTSSEEKEAKLRHLGARHTINYKEDQEWGQTAKKKTLDQRGADFVIEVGGPGTLEQSSKAAAIDAQVAIVGRISVNAGNRETGNWNPHGALHGTRRIMVGSQLQFEEMNRAIEINKIRPIIDERIFGFEEAREAFQYLWDQKHFRKVVIKFA
ncbi:MAG: hypothetical protein M1821_003396 [Bathelium mastoideum]|nr:MAG: hypothetical protein M1821_003396 [Bathelium mastoideum]